MIFAYADTVLAAAATRAVIAVLSLDLAIGHDGARPCRRADVAAFI